MLIIAEPSAAAHCRRLAAAALVCAAFAAPAGAQPTVRLELGARETVVNESVFAELIVENHEQEVGRPAPPDLQRAKIRYVGGPNRSERYVITQGRQHVTRSTSYHYEITPAVEGIVIIPGFVVEVDGRRMETAPVRLNVRRGDPQELLIAEITCDAKTLYVGQQATFTLAIWIKPSQAGRRELNANEMYVLLQGYRQGFGPFPPPRQSVERIRTFEDGSYGRYYVYETQYTTVLNHPGPPPFADLVIGMSYPTGYERGIFGDLVPSAVRHLRVPPIIAAPEVLPLPTDGRPRNFNGAVGSLEMRVRAAPTAARVGDPITLTIEISGHHAPLETLPPPMLEANPELMDGFRVPRETLAGAVQAGMRRFTQSIRARSKNVTRIPPIEYPYFDPVAGEYRVARSEPIPITISAAETLDPAALAEFLTSSRDDDAAEPAVRDVLRGMITSESEVLRRSSDITMTHAAVAALAPPGAFLAVWATAFVFRRQDEQSPRRRAQRAASTARDRIRQATALPPRDRPGAVASALAGYLADRCNEPPARFAGRAGADFLTQRGVNGDCVRLWAETIERCECAAYAGDGETDPALFEQADECLRRLELERI